MSKKYVLIVDCDKYSVRYLSHILQSRGYEVETSDNCNDALRKLKSILYNIVIMEIEQADMNGTELLSEISQINPHIIKIVVTAYATLDNVISSLNLGADAFLLKPLSADKLIKVVEEKLVEQEKALLLSDDHIKDWLERRIFKLNQDYAYENTHTYTELS